MRLLRLEAKQKREVVKRSDRQMVFLETHAKGVQIYERGEERLGLRQEAGKRIRRNLL